MDIKDKQTTPPGAPGDDYVTIRELCAAAGISRQHLHERFTRRGEGPTMTRIRIGRFHRVAIARDEADRWLIRYFARKATRQVLADQRRKPAKPSPAPTRTPATPTTTEERATA